MHIIANNQIGFTTEPEESRSTRYASDLAKGFDMPIIHVNADDPEACISAVRLAMAYREEFKRGVVIDLIGYRRFGHNEADEPAYTQPLHVRDDQASTRPCASSTRTRWSTQGIIGAGRGRPDAEEAHAAARDGPRGGQARADGGPTTAELQLDRTAERGARDELSRSTGCSS